MRTWSRSFLVLLVIGASLLIAGCVQSQPGGNNTIPASTAAPADATGTPALGNVISNETLVSFVDDAVAYAQAHDRDKALAAFSNPNGSFVKGELYIYAYDFNGTTLVLPFNPEKVGVNRMNETDAQGGFFIRNLTDAARNGTGFVRYSYPNPTHNNTVESKLGYVVKVDDTWFLGSGIYTGPAISNTTNVQSVPK